MWTTANNELTRDWRNLAPNRPEDPGFEPDLHREVAESSRNSKLSALRRRPPFCNS